jgi:kynurenine formamidase
MTWYETATAAEREYAAGSPELIKSPGLAHDESVAEWLWDHQISAVACDNPTLEAQPVEFSTVNGFLHYQLIALLGMAIGELFQLDLLAADCAADGVYEGMFTSAPLNKVGGSGSTANALAIK